MIRALHIIGSLERAGIQSFVMNLYRTIDRNKIQFDFAIYNAPTENSYAEEAKKLGARIFLIPPKNEGFSRNYRAIRDLVRNERYEVVWRGCSNCFAGLDLVAAKAGGARKRILHSHNTHVKGANLLLHYLFRPLCNAYATQRLSCGIKAGQWMFGKRSFQVIPNGIDTGKFKYNEEVRKQYRADFSIQNRFVIGSVARFDEQKNQGFMLNVLDEYNRLYGNAVLLLVGDGPLKSECERKAKELGIESDVLFLGRRADVAELMQTMDVFIM
nr:glycosyltransferase [Lachnospiraceae bacterium]